MNDLDPGLQFIFKELNTNINFIDINLKIQYKRLHFGVYLKPTIILVTFSKKVIIYRTQKAILHFH